MEAYELKDGFKITVEREFSSDEPHLEIQLAEFYKSLYKRRNEAKELIIINE